MDSLEFARTARPDAELALRPRSFLFLGGPLSRFFEHLARALIARGHRAHKVNLHLGEQLYWRLPATNYRGRLADWRDFIAGVLDSRQVTDLIFVGDRRPYHLVAAEEARARGIAVICTDFGYLRPDWITVEYDGTTTLSRFPRDPDAIRALAAEQPEPDLRPQFLTPFRLVAALDVGFTVPQVLGRVLYPHYRWHGIYHPFAEYAGWLVALARRRLGAAATAAACAELQSRPGSYFVFPLQLATDFQIRAHSQYADIRDAVREVVRSFAASGSGRRLAVVVHPLDNGLIDWRRLVERETRGRLPDGQVVVIEGGIPAELLSNAAGVVTINSTVGITALYHRLPVKALGNAIFDIPGLTDPAPLDRFWHAPTPPDPDLTRDFLRALAGTTQIKGGFHERTARAHAIPLMVERLERGLYPLPPVSDAELARRQLRPIVRTAVIADAADGEGRALARAAAEPGVRLYLIGTDPEGLARTAGDCRRRGALVATGTAESAAAFDREFPVDLVVAAGGAARDAAEALAEPMRRRGRGTVVVVAAAGETPALRRRFAGVRLVVAGPGWLVRRLAAVDPRVAALSADDAAELILRGVARGAAAVALPPALRAIRRAVRLGLRRLAGWPVRAYRRSLDEAAEAQTGALRREQGD